ncbi:MAG: transporter [Bacteroidales bacterium]
MRKLAILLLISSIFHSSANYGQSLAAGNPSLSDAEQGYLSNKELAFSLTYQNSYSNKFYNEDRVYNGLENIINAYSNYVEFKTTYGFTPKISTSMELGYFFNKTINYQDSSYNGYGLGDAAIYLKYRLISSKTAKFMLLPAIGIKLPIGVFDQTIGTTKLPLMLQPSSGNFKYNVSIYMLKILNDKLSIASMCFYEYAPLINSKNFYYKYGDQWKLSFFAKYKFSENFSTNLQFRFENKDKENKEFEKIIEYSGYKIVIASPQISYIFSNNWQISAYADLPIYQYYNGIQLAQNYSFSLKLLKKFDFKF